MNELLYNKKAVQAMCKQSYLRGLSVQANDGSIITNQTFNEWLEELINEYK